MSNQSTRTFGAAALLALLTTLGVSARTAINAGTSNVTLPGTGVVVALAGDAGTLDAAGAADGAVVVVANGVPTLAAISGGASLPDVAGVADGATLAQVGGAQTWAAPAPTGPTLTTLRASDCVAEAGLESASITGSGAASTLTLTASTTARDYGTGGATAARVVCPLPAGAREIEVEAAVTAASGWTSPGGRYLGMALRNAINGGAPAALWGMAVNDNGGTVFAGNLSTAANTGGTSSGNAAGTPAANRWYRMMVRATDAFLGVTVGTGSAGARPALWSPLTTAVSLPSGATAYLVDTAPATAVVVYLQSFGGGSGTTSVTAGLTIRVVSYP